MPFTWTGPDDWKPVQIVRMPTHNGRKQLLLAAEFLDGNGGSLGHRTIGLNAATVQHWVNAGQLVEPEGYDPDENAGKSYAQLKFDQLYDMVPEIPQATLDLLKTKLPDAVLQSAW